MTTTVHRFSQVDEYEDYVVAKCNSDCVKYLKFVPYNESEDIGKLYVVFTRASQTPKVYIWNDIDRLTFDEIVSSPDSLGKTFHKNIDVRHADASEPFAGIF